MNQFELKLKGLPIRQPSAGYIDRILAERPKPTRREPSGLLRRRRIWFALPVAAATLVVLCLSALWYWPSGEVKREVAKAPAPLVKDHAPAQFDGVRRQPSNAAKPAVSRDLQDGPAVSFGFQEDRIDGQLVAKKTPDIPRPVFKKAERVFRHPTFSEGLAAFAGPLAQGAAPVGKGLDTALGYIDISGQFVIAPRFRRAEDFKHGIARVRETDDQPYYYIDHNGRRVSEEFVVKDPKPVLQPVRRAHGCGYVDTRTGKLVIEPAYDDAYPFHDGLALVRKDQTCGYIDTTGKVVIPLKYREASHFSEGLAPVRLSVEEAKAAGTQWSETGWTPWCYIDRTGKLVLPARYSTARPFSEGLAYVSEYYVTPEGFRGFINHKGTHVLDMRDISDIKRIDPKRMPFPVDH